MRRLAQARADAAQRQASTLKSANADLLAAAAAAERHAIQADGHRGKIAQAAAAAEERSAGGEAAAAAAAARARQAEELAAAAAAVAAAAVQDRDAAQARLRFLALGFFDWELRQALLSNGSSCAHQCGSAGAPEVWALGLPLELVPGFARQRQFLCCPKCRAGAPEFWALVLLARVLSWEFVWKGQKLCRTWMQRGRA